MRFYDYQPAPSPRRVRMFIAEKGIEIPTTQIDLRAEEQLGEEFRAINPRCTVPVLVLDDGTCLNDTLSICWYLESLYPEPNLMGFDAREQALVMNWHERVVSDGFMAVAESFRNYVKGFSGRALTGTLGHEQIPALVERGKKRLELFLAQLDERLAESPFVALERFTMADISAFVCIEFAGWIKVPVTDQWANIARWHAEIAKRPSAAL